MNPLTIKLVGGVLLASLLFGAGFGVEYRNMVAYKAEQKGITEAQAAQVKATDLKNKGDANDAQQSYAQAITSLDAYYKQHPVIKLQNTSCNPLSQTSPGSTGTDATPTSLYASTYSPEDTELVANQLDLLIKLLYNDGVTIK
jgi:hypothetical protein